MFDRWKLGFSCDDRLFLKGGMGKRKRGTAESLTALLKKP